jgi:ribosomal protein L29
MKYKTYKELNESSIEQWAAELDESQKEDCPMRR